MKMNKNKQRQNERYFQGLEGEDFHKAVKIQIQRVAKETANLIGLLEGGLQKAGIDSSEYKMIRDFGTSFLDDLVRIARKLCVQLQ
jgi:predicted aconitase